MSNDNKFNSNGHQSKDYGYQPKEPGVNGGYQPPRQVTQPVPPPKKP